MKHVRGETGRMETKHTGLYDKGEEICTRPVPDYPVVGGTNIMPRHNGGYFITVARRIKGRERGRGSGFWAEGLFCPLCIIFLVDFPPGTHRLAGGSDAPIFYAGNGFHKSVVRHSPNMVTLSSLGPDPGCYEEMWGSCPALWAHCGIL